MNFLQGRKPCLPLGTKREEEREGEWEGVGKRGVNGNFYNLIKLLKKKESQKILDRCAADTKRPWDAKIDYYTQQSFQSPSMEKTRYSMTKTVIKYYVPTNPVPQKVLEGKPQLKKVNCPHKNTGNI